MDWSLFYTVMLKPLIKELGDMSESVVRTATFQKILVPLSKAIKDEVFAANMIVTILVAFIISPIAILEMIFEKHITTNIIILVLIFVVSILVCFVFVYKMKTENKVARRVRRD